MKRHEKVKHQATIDQFCGLSNLGDVAQLLKVKKNDLAFILYKLNGGREYQYRDYDMPKKTGGVRTISAPTGSLKILQGKLNGVLQHVYWEKPSAHAFIHKRSIRTNAEAHARKQYVLNIDLKDFFPTINFGRVRGMFISKPYEIDPSAATVLAQIACYQGSIPQGAPTSPIISNMICSKLDSELQRLAKAEKCNYTRYADDITFSTNLKLFPKNVFDADTGALSAALVQIVDSNGFTINPKKTRLQHRIYRQEVTGLIVNEFVNVKRTYVHNVRAMLHDWETKGLAAAENRFLTRYCHRPQFYKSSAFKNVVRGRIEFIRSIKSKHRANRKSPNGAVHLRLLDQFHINCLRDISKTVIRTEGKTDWMHMLAALLHLQSTGQFTNLDIAFYKSRDESVYGQDNLKKFCEKVKKGIIKPFRHKVICVFDRDTPDIVKIHNNLPAVDWTGNVFSILIPKPTTIPRPDPISIEFLHPDILLKSQIEGRRLYTSDEFDANCKLKTNQTISYRGKLPVNGPVKIIDSNVYDASTQKNIALSKARFARAIQLKEIKTPPVDFSGFVPLFDLIGKI